MSALEAVGISKSYPGVRALDDVTLRVAEGQLVGLLGENGAGKSTLLKILAGVETPDRGTLTVAGRISAIFQELSLLPNLTIAENLFLGREPRTRIGTIDYRAMNERSRQHLARVRFDVDPARFISELRIGQQQLVEIAGAISKDARVIIMDEPTSALSVQETAILRELTLGLKRQGVAILYITHKLSELDGMADRVMILRDGRVVAEGEWGAYSEAEIVRLMVGREARFERVRPKAPRSDEVLAVEGASLPHPTRRGQFVVKDVSLRVARGEVLGLFGLMGAGRTELLELIFGMHAQRGSLRMRINDAAADIRGPGQAIAAGIAMAPENRKEDGLVLDMSARGNASLASLRAASRWGLISAGREHSYVRPFLEKFRMRGGGSLDAPIRNFSGGNQQKVILARWLATQPRILLLDEPTRGIDVNAKQEIYELICELAASGLAVVLASSELPEVLALSHRILVMCEGRKAAELTADGASAELIMRAALPQRQAGGQS